MRSPRKKSNARFQDSYRKVAWFYDAWSYLTESKAAGRVLELANIQNGETVLEVAVGTGIVFRQIVRQNPGGLTVGIDLSPAMLSRAHKRMIGSGLENYALQTGDARRLPFENDQFDLIINNFMFDLLPEGDFLPVLAEFRRALKPGGRIVIATMVFGNKWYHRFWEWIARQFPALLTGCRPIRLQPFLSDAGFHNIHPEFLSQNTFPVEILTAICDKTESSV